MDPGAGGDAPVVAQAVSEEERHSMIKIIQSTAVLSRNALHHEDCKNQIIQSALDIAQTGIKHRDSKEDARQVRRDVYYHKLNFDGYEEPNAQ